MFYLLGEATSACLHNSDINWNQIDSVTPSSSVLPQYIYIYATGFEMVKQGVFP